MVLAIDGTCAWLLGIAGAANSDSEGPSQLERSGHENDQISHRGALAVRSQEDGAVAGARGKSKAKAKAKEKGDVSTELVESDVGRPMMELMDPVGTPLQPTQHVLQVCLGHEHAVLLTDAGAVFTWGDNRYGQLGREATSLEEDRQAFPVPALQSDEISQVAAGKHHCLALSAGGKVWAWGRNKAGQLGCGHLRDAVSPTYVLYSLQHGPTKSRCLGDVPPGEAEDASDPIADLVADWHIITIGAGVDSSVAVSANSAIWQWGGIGKRAANDKADESGDHRKDSMWAQRVKWEKKDRSKPGERLHRLGKWAAIDEAHSEEQSQRVAIVESVEHLRVQLARSQENLARLDAALQKRARNQRTQFGGDADIESMSTFHATLAQLAQEIQGLERETEALTSSKARCEQALQHVREQLQSVENAGVKLETDKDKYLKKLQTVDQSDHRAFYQNRVKEWEQLLAANQSTQSALMDQRADADREKHRISKALAQKITEKKKLESRRQVVQDLNKSSSGAHAVSDPMVKFLQEQNDAIRKRFMDKASEATFFAAAKHSFEQDSVFLDRVELQMTEWFHSQAPESRDRAAMIVDMLQDIVDLRRSWSSMLEDRWLKQDLDMSFFLGGSGVPAIANRPHSSFWTLALALQ